MGPQVTRRRSLLSTAALAAALSAYGRRAYGACLPAGGSNFVCSGVTPTTTINLANAQVSTQPGFSITTGSATALTIIGDGALSYTDMNASGLAGATTGLSIGSLGTGTDSVNVSANGNITGGSFGISARNTVGGGAVVITATGNVTGTNSRGIQALNFGTDLSVTTGAGKTVTGSSYGVFARNYGTGATSVTVNGDVTALGAVGNAGILARGGAVGTDVSVTTAAGTAVTGRRYGIFARNDGAGALSVIANGDVTGNNSVGIFARTSGASLTVTTGPSSNGVIGGARGIYARNFGIGALSIATNGDVTGGSFAGIDAQNNFGAGTDLTVTTAAGTTVAGGLFGLRAFNYGSGAVAIAVNGDVTGTSTGITALNYNGTSLIVTTGAGTTISGGSMGLSAINYGSGGVTITVNGDVTGAAGDGIYACHGISFLTCGAGGGGITITVGAASTVTSNGAGFAIDIVGDPGNVTVAGRLNGGSGGAIHFDQSAALANRLELHPTAIINGNVLGGPGTDTLVLGGEGTGSFNVGAIGPGLQYQSFEIFLKEGGSHWTLTGTTAAVTPWSINQGTLAISSDANLGAPSGGLAFGGGTLLALASFASDRTVTLNAGGGTVDTNGHTATLGGTIGGIGGLTKIGAGILALSNADTYTGATTVTAGTLIVNGSIANSAVTINAGATLAGTGTVGATTILSGATFAPGPIGTAGTMTVAGNLAFQSGSLYLVQVNPSNASSTNVIAGGSAALAGIVNIAFASGSYVPRSYTILSAAGGLGGTTFAGVTGNLTNFTTSLSYTPTDVVFNIAAALGAGTQLNQSQQNVASTINSFFNGGGTLPPNFLNVFGLTGSNLSNALTLQSGEPATGAQQGAFKLMDQFLGLMLDPFVDGRSGPGGAGGPALGFAPERKALPGDIASAYSKGMKTPVYKSAPVAFEQRWTAWGAGYGGQHKTSGDPVVVGSHDLIARIFGYAAGLDYHVTRDTVAGFALAGGGTNWSLAQGLGSGRSDAFQAGMYAATRSGPAYLAASLAFANHWMSTDRFAAFGDHLTADFKAQSYGGRVETGYRFGTPIVGVTPYAAVQAQSFRTPGYSEVDGSGGGFGLAYDSRTGTDTRSELGARFDHVAAFNRDAVLTLRSRLAWAHDWVSNPSLAAAFQALPGTNFIVNGATPAKDSALVSTGAELRLVNGVTLLAKFVGEIARGSQTYAGMGTVRYTW